MNIDELALKVGATHYSPAPMRAVRGWSFTFDQLQALIEEYEKDAGSEPAGFATPDSIDWLKDQKGLNSIHLTNEKFSSRDAPLYLRPDPRVAELEAQLVEWKSTAEQHNENFDTLAGNLRMQNTALLVALEQMRDALSKALPLARSWAAPYTQGLDKCEESLAIPPSTELLEARDRKRDAQLLRAACEKVVTGYISGELKALAFARESGEWKPEL